MVKQWKKRDLTSMPAIVSTTERERAIREEACRDAVTNLRLEGLEMDEESTRIFQRHVDGEITSEEFRATIDNLNERKFGPAPQSGN
jgi:hypothetical protein